MILQYLVSPYFSVFEEYIVCKSDPNVERPNNFTYFYYFHLLWRRMKLSGT